MEIKGSVLQINSAFSLKGYYIRNFTYFKVLAKMREKCGVFLTMDDESEEGGEQLTLNQRARGSSPRRPTIFFNDLRASRSDPDRGKNCFRPVSGISVNLPSTFSRLLCVYAPCLLNIRATSGFHRQAVFE